MGGGPSRVWGRPSSVRNPGQCREWLPQEPANFKPQTPHPTVTGRGCWEFTNVLVADLRVRYVSTACPCRYPIVSAASIVAKVIRDKSLTDSQKVRQGGSGVGFRAHD